MSECGSGASPPSSSLSPGPPGSRGPSSCSGTLISSRRRPRRCRGRPRAKGGASRRPPSIRRRRSPAWPSALRTKSRAGRSGGDLPARPMQKRRPPCACGPGTAAPSSRTALCAVLSAMRMPAALRNVSATRRYPYPNLISRISPLWPAARSPACPREGSPRGGNRRSAESGYSRLGDFARPNSCCSMAMVAPSAYPSAKRCLNSAE